MSWAVLAESDGIVGKHVNDGKFHQSTQAQRSPHVIDEGEKSRAEGPDFYQAHSIHYGAHGMLADAEVEIAARLILRGEIACSVAGKHAVDGWCQVGRSSHAPGH